MATLSDDINDYCFIDTETKALPQFAGTLDADVTTCGAYRYSECAIPIMVQYAIGDGPVNVSAFKDFDVTRRFMWAYGYMPEELIRFHERALKGKAWYVAWNMAFDRLMLNRIPHCVVRPDMTIDAMAQAAASNLPAKLEGASRALGRGGKQFDGKELIKLFTGADWKTVTPQTHPEEWERFKSYGGQDIVELREVFRSTRPLDSEEWREYWASERINDRGMKIDAEFATRAAAVAEAHKARLSSVVRQISGGAITAVTQRQRIAEWLFDRMTQLSADTDSAAMRKRYDEARDKLVTLWRDEDEITGEDDDLVPSKLSIAEEPLTAFINDLDALDEALGLSDEEFDVLTMAEARLFGASSTPAKFQKALDQSSGDDRLRGQYRFNGAAQTHRFSSQGVQVHNLIRASLTDKQHPTREIDVIEYINELEV